MIQISGFGSIQSTSGTGKRRGASSVDNFADILAAAEAEEPGAALHANDIASASALSNLLALQEISQEDVQRKKLVQQGHNMLDSLENIRRHLLTGTMPAQALINLMREISVKKQMINDPALTEIIDDIELRAAVELAKLQRAIRPEE